MKEATWFILFPCLLASFMACWKNPQAPERQAPKVSPDTQLIPYRKGEKWGFAAAAKSKEEAAKGIKIVIPPKYDAVSLFENGFARVFTKNKGRNGSSAGGKWGLVNRSGNEIVPPKYSEIGSFSEGMAPIAVGGNRNEVGWLVGGKWGFVDTNGKEVVPPKYQAVGGFSEGMAFVGLGGKLDEYGRLEGGKWGFIDRHGKEVIALQYDGAKSFSGGIAPVKREGKWGFINKQGKW